MEKKAYHHGNLKNDLIEAGLELLNEYGEHQFSLRKVAVKCGVSSAAPYAHFSSKEDLIAAMQDYVTSQFMEYLVQQLQKVESPDPFAEMIQLGVGYIHFFLQNPHYYAFLFNQPCFQVNISADEDDKDNFPPYQLFCKLVKQLNLKIGRSVQKDALERDTIKLWAQVHGIVAIASMKHVTWEKDWETEVKGLLL